MAHWWQETVVYQIYPRSFNDSNGDGVGDLEGIIEKLDYLADLGIGCIWLSPVYKSPMADNGYDIADYYQIAEEFGDLDTLRKLIAEADKRGIRLIMDLVANHTSDEHPWFVESRKSKDNPYRDFYIWRDPQPDGSAPNDLRSFFAADAWTYDETTGQYYLHFFDPKQPDLNWDNPEVHEKIYEMMNWWFDQGIAGFRMDVIELIGKDPDKKISFNGPTLHKRIQEMNERTFGGRDLLTVGETWHASLDEAKAYARSDGKELSMAFQFEHIRVGWPGEDDKFAPVDFDLDELKAILVKWHDGLEGEAWPAWFLNNHDLPRLLSRWGDEGIYRVDAAKMLAAFLFGLKGTPFIYQGEEIGMTNVAYGRIEDYNDVETFNRYRGFLSDGLNEKEALALIHIGSRDNARTPMQWSDAPQAGFTTGTPWLGVNPNYKAINAEADLADPEGIYHFYRRLIQRKRKDQTLIHGRFELVPSDRRLLVHRRLHEGRELLCLYNFSKETVTTAFPGNRAGFQVLEQNMDIELQDDLLTLPPFAALWLERS